MQLLVLNNCHDTPLLSWTSHSADDNGSISCSGPEVDILCVWTAISHFTIQLNLRGPIDQSNMNWLNRYTDIRISVKWGSVIYSYWSSSARTVLTSTAHQGLELYVCVASGEFWGCLRTHSKGIPHKVLLGLNDWCYACVCMQLPPLVPGSDVLHVWGCQSVSALKSSNRREERLWSRVISGKISQKWSFKSSCLFSK